MIGGEHGHAVLGAGGLRQERRVAHGGRGVAAHRLLDHARLVPHQRLDARREVGTGQDPGGLGRDDAREAFERGGEEDLAVRQRQQLLGMSGTGPGPEAFAPAAGENERGSHAGNLVGGA